ncbi:putative cyclin [Rosa chinensis]|uniref:B-like cyclin n=1 Tax=Rosa chinensis TaxID=74649 RepID=A0A2P6PXF0_ROSCH|nr:cyclin-A1-4 isoform X2 [Rosa chinensis]PRQ26608.1 putative cyclin [Rosa chinensis]
MSTRNRRAPPSSSSSSANRLPIPQNPNKKAMAAKPQVAKKRTALCDVTNQRNGSQIGSRSSASSSKPMVPCTTKVVKTKKETSTFISNHGLSGNVFLASLSSKSSILVPFSDTSISGTVESIETIATNHSPNSRGTVFPAPSSIIHALRSKDVSPSRSVSGSVSLDESMSTSNSLKSPEFEYIDNEDISEVKSIEKKTINSLHITDIPQIEGIIRKRDIFTDTVTIEEVLDIDNNLTDPQFCATIASDIYKYLLESEVNRRPSVDFMETVQKDINSGMRAILIDWLVEVAEEFRLVPETLFLTVNYVDRYLSGNVMKRQRLQLLGVACMMIAAKYEEIHVPEVEEFCYITDNTYFKDEVLKMESDVLNHLKFEMTAPTAMCFLRRFCSVAEMTSEVPPLLFQYLAHYIGELSLLEYSMLGYAPSLIAASATFLAKYILSPSQKPWNSTLRHYTTYQASDLCDCVKVLHHLCCNGSGSNLAAVREKYCQHKYKFVAKKYCPQSIPPEFFHDLSN